VDSDHNSKDEDKLPNSLTPRLGSRKLIHGDKARKRRKGKAFKVKLEIKQMVVGSNINDHRIQVLMLKTLVGRFEYLSSTCTKAKSSIIEKWKPIIGYSPKFNRILKG